MTKRGIANYAITLMKTNSTCQRCGKTNSGPAYIHTCTPKEVMEQALAEQDQKADLNEPEQDCYGDGSVYRGVRSNDSEIRTIFNRSEPARKPMTEEEITLELKSYGYGPCSEYADGFEDGIRFAEKHHGIGGGE